MFQSGISSQKSHIMASRRVSPEVQQLFEKYIQPDTPGRRLSRHDAIAMLTSELGINESRAQMIFDHFDKDGNGAMSLWEFQHLFNVAGRRCTEIIDLYETIDDSNKGYITLDQARKVLPEIPMSDGDHLDEKEVELFAKTAGTNELVTFGDFIDLYARVKMYRRPKRR